jgi:hypothetical protein
MQSLLSGSRVRSGHRGSGRRVKGPLMRMGWPSGPVDGLGVIGGGGTLAAVGSGRARSKMAF